MLTVILHRWQPKKNRYRDQKFELSEESGCVSFAINARSAITDGRFVAILGETDVDCRTQQLDRIDVNIFNGTVEVWLSPAIERNYTPRARGSKWNAKKQEAVDRLYEPTSPSLSNSALIESPVCEYCRILPRAKGSRFCSLECEFKGTP